MPKLLPLVLALLGLMTTARATVQERDTLTLHGERGWIEEHPFGPVIKKRDLDFNAKSTANYRGYVAGWRISDGRLYLTEFVGNVRGREKKLKWLFPKAKDAVFADWFSGKLHLNLGIIRMRKLAGHVGVTDKLVVIEVKDGIVRKRTDFAYPKNIPTINAQVSAFLGEKVDIRRIDY